MSFCCSEIHFAGWLFHHSFLNLLFSPPQYCSLYFRWACIFGYSIITSAGFITPSLSLRHTLSFIDCIQQSLNGAVVRTQPLSWADKVNWEFSNVWVVHTFLFNRHDFTLLNTEIYLPSFIWITEVWIPPQPSGSSKWPWLIFSPVITPPPTSYMHIYNKHYIPKQADVSYPNLKHFLSLHLHLLFFLKTGLRRLWKTTATFAGDHAKSPALHSHLEARQPEGSQWWATQAASKARWYLLSKRAASQHHYVSSLHHGYRQISKTNPCTPTDPSRCFGGFECGIEVDNIMLSTSIWFDKMPGSSVIETLFKSLL